MPQIILPYRPFPVHEAFHRTAAREKAAIGAVGSGKTLALCGDALAHCLEQPGSVAMLCRQTVPSLKDTTEAEFLNMISTPPDDFEAGDEAVTLADVCTIRRSAGHTDKIIFPNGSELRFRSLDDWRKIMSYNVSYIGIDEASEVDAETYINLMSRIRQRQPTAAARRMGYRWEPSLVRQQMAIATNPDGHNWIWQYFINSPRPNSRYFESTSFDNPTLYDPDGTPSAYLMSLLTMPEVWIQRFVLCSHDAFAGQIYNFDPVKHVHVHFEPGPDWERAMGMDWGIRNPTAIGWWARKPGTTKWYKYREWQSYDPTVQSARDSYTSTTVDEVALTIKRLEAGENIKWRAADPMIWRRQTGDKENTTIEYHFARHGLHFQAGARDYSSRINAVNKLLEEDNLSMSDRCVMSHMGYQQYRWAELSIDRGDRDQAERPRKKDDHLVDADQYLFTLFANSIAPPDPVPEETRERVMANFHADLRNRMKAQLQNQSRRVVH